LGDVYPCDFQDNPALDCYVKGHTGTYMYIYVLVYECIYTYEGNSSPRLL
jgi:hypothetical protein